MSETFIPITYRATRHDSYSGDDWLKLEQAEDSMGNAAEFEKWANITGNLPTSISNVFSAWESFVTQ